MKLGVIGCGKMGRALLEGVLRSNIVPPGGVTVYDQWHEAAAAAGKELAVSVAGSNAEVVDAADVVLLCVKPQGFPEMLAELGSAEDRLLISIAAGITIRTIEEAVNRRHRVVRVMPNTPSLVGRGAAAYALGGSAMETDADTTQRLLASVGYVCRVEEDQLDAVTALSGSGPAYVFFLIEALIEGAVEQGLSPETARDLAVHTVGGAAELLLKTGEAPSVLRENVTSPNGTTFAALESFRSHHFPEIVKKAVAAAAERSRELGKA